MAKNKEEQTKQWPKIKKNRQSNDQKQRRTDKTMTKNNDEQTKMVDKTLQRKLKTKD